ncbi:histidine kinase [Nocardia sp. CC201C]|uniref:sensor histidine kinase n=1 Tax=Nocardia sp. CC201C TaxID=3044575 RepID=UPI0024A88549|nr:histidine kinase [Nocardia sp. CC201C]
MRRLLFALCVLPAGLAALLELNATGSLLWTGVDAGGAALGSWACWTAAREDAVRLTRHAGVPLTRRAGVVAALAGPVLAITAVSLWPQGVQSWAVASAWVAVVASGVAASRIITVADAGLTGALAVAAVGSPLALRTDDVPIGVLIITVPTVTALGIGLLVRAQRQRLVAERGAAVAGERAQMARELHDVIAHEVMGMVVLAQAAQAGAEERTRPLLARIEQSGRRALGDIRSLVDTLGDGAGSRGTYDLDDLVSRFADTVDAEVVSDIDPDVRDARVPDPVALAAHRVLAEAFNNIRRYAADASRIDAVVRIRDAELAVEVCDNGSGTAGLGGGSGTGLTGLAARAAAVGGTVTAGRLPDGRWRVAARLPVDGKAGGI